MRVSGKHLHKARSQNSKSEALPGNRGEGLFRDLYAIGTRIMKTGRGGAGEGVKPGGTWCLLLLLSKGQNVVLDTDVTRWRVAFGEEGVVPVGALSSGSGSESVGAFSTRETRRSSE